VGAKDLQRVGRLADFPPGVMHPIVLDGLDIAVVNLEGELHAFGNFCPHEGVTLTSGYGALLEDMVACMLHSSLFEIASGEVIAGPAYTGLTKYEVRTDGADVFIARA
jgi:3-phenylpropionate/trans-cinnamate dioxygenase ferredoxin subunit